MLLARMSVSILFVNIILWLGTSFPLADFVVWEGDTNFYGYKSAFDIHLENRQDFI